MEFIRTLEFNIEPDVHSQITDLRNLCFPNCRSDRSYYKQLPHFRYLVYDNALLIAHLGIDHRVISVGDSIFKIFGLIDLCVMPDYRRRGIATELLNRISKLAREKSVDFLLLVADDDRLYARHGFKYVSNYCSFLRIHEHQNYRVALEKIENDFMVKQTGSKSWDSEGLMDLLGYRM